MDVEDYFMVEAFASHVRRDSWGEWPSRVDSNTRHLLDLFDRHQVKATFFFVGWIADRHPALVREVLAHGHEIGCHGYWHRTVYSQTPAEFRQDTKAAVRAIEDAAGAKVYGYRAPTWSITHSCLWALDILAEEGFQYDSSIYAIHHDLYGCYGAPRFPYWHLCENGRLLGEFPPPTVKLLGAILPGAGGGYLRIFPLTYTRWVFRQFERAYRQPVVVYCHPWEIDPDQPRIRAGLRSQVRHYTNLADMERRLQFLLRHYRFQPFREAFNRQLSSEEPQAMKTDPPDLQSGCVKVSAGF